MGRGWLGAGILAVFLVLGLVIAAAGSNAHMPTGALLEQAAENIRTFHSKETFTVQCKCSVAFICK